MPAHNEEAVIDRCLASLLAQVFPGRIQVLVVANGCSEATASVANAWIPWFCKNGHVLGVAQLAHANKIEALNRGDELALGRHRLYLDADIVLSRYALAEMLREFEERGVSLCAPICELERPRSWVTRCYAAVWKSLPYFKNGIIGCGVYAVSEAGRRRWGQFPALIADDKYVRLLFGDSERSITASASFTVRLPEGFVELSNVRARWSAGNRELAAKHPEMVRADSRCYGESILWALLHPWYWPACLVFTTVYVAADLRARIRWRAGNSHWERAESIRESG